MESESDNILLIVAVIAVAVSLIAGGITYLSISNLAGKISGYATGQANLTVESSVAINLTTAFISWGSGRVNSDKTLAQLTTLETNNVTNGNWTLVQAGGLRVENTGNVNVTLNISAGKTAANYISGTNPGYQWNISNVEGSSCLNASGKQVVTLNLWAGTSTTTATICDPFQFAGGSDSIRIDLNLTIPENSLTGALTDTLTFTAST